MNKSILTIAAIISLAIATPVWAETPDLDPNQQEEQAACKRYAQEDQIAPDQMAEYMSRCLQDVVEPVDGDYGPAASESEEEFPETHDGDPRG